MGLTKTEYERMLKMYEVARSEISKLKDKPIFLTFPNPNFINGKISCLIDTILEGSEEVKLTKLTIKVLCPPVRPGILPVRRPGSQRLPYSENTCQIYKERLQRAILTQKTYQSKEGVAGYALLKVQRTAIPATPASLEVVKKNSDEDLPYLPIQSLLERVNDAIEGSDYITNVKSGSPKFEVETVFMDNVVVRLSEMNNDMIRVEVQKPSAIRSLVNNGTERIKKIGGTFKKAIGMNTSAEPVRTQNKQQNIVISPTGIKDVSLIEAFEMINEIYNDEPASRTIVKNKKFVVRITPKRNGQTITIDGLVDNVDYADSESITLQFVPENKDVFLKLSNRDVITIANVELQMFSYVDLEVTT